MHSSFLPHDAAVHFSSSNAARTPRISGRIVPASNANRQPAAANNSGNGRDPPNANARR
jgi:hypothetical protein